MNAGERFTPGGSLRWLRRQAGLSVEDVAARAGCAPALVVAAETDAHGVGPRVLGLLADVLADALAAT